MSWRSNPDFGQQLLLELLQTLRTDERWVVDDFNGFRWWPSDQCQHVWCDEGIFQNAITTYRIHAETDVIKGSGRARQFEVDLERQMDQSTLNALVYHEAEDVYRLHSSMFATEENMEFLKRTSFAAIILQLHEARALAQKLRESLRAVPANSSHPTMGMRPQDDPMMQAHQSFFVPAGREPSKWSGVPEWRETEFAVEREATKFTSDHLTHLVAEFPWEAHPGHVIRLDVNTREPHPELGNGLHMTLSIPLIMSPERVSHMALELNQYERDQWKRVHMLGSWACHDGLLCFRLFLPNILYRTELLVHFVLQMAVRAHWTNEYFLDLKRAAEAARAGTS